MDTTSSQRNPVLWLLIAVPLATLVAGAWTLRLASDASPIVIEPDQVRRTAQVQVLDDRADRQASQAGSKASLQRGEADRWQWDQQASSADVLAKPLRLQAVHRADAARDVRIDLASAQAFEWRVDDPAAYRFELRDAPGQWRLVGHWSDDCRCIRFHPLLASE